MQLHDYQKLAVDHLTRNNRAGLFLDMGLGKTAVALSALGPEHLPALVVAPKRVAENVWETEAKLWRPDLDVRAAKGSPSARKVVLDAGADVVVLGRDVLADALPYRDRWRTIILDELSGFKTRKSNRWKTARKLMKGRQLQHRWGLTGTPSPNGLIDLWAQLYLLDDGQRLGPNLTTYRNRYFSPGPRLPNGIITRWDPRPEADKRIHELLEDICLSMDGEGRIDLPEVTFNPVEVPLPSSARKIYREFKENLVADLSLLGGEIHTAGTAAALTNKLSQISAGFLYVDDADLRDGKHQILHREKPRAVQEIVEGTGSPVLVFYHYRPELDMLKAQMPELVHTIDEPDIIERWNAGKVPVLAAHPASIGHGLNLQHGGHTAVWTTLPWSLEEWEQSNKRLARQGQKHPVVIHMLQTAKTVDRSIRKALDQKTSIQDALLEHLESPL